MGKSSIYLASSWRNPDQQNAIKALRKAGHPTYDFRNPDDEWSKTYPGDGSGGFRWDEIDPHWVSWSPWAFLSALGTQTAQDGYDNDFNAMEKAGMCVLLLPCGRSAHIEAGYFAGHPDKSLHIVVPNALGERLEYAEKTWEPELMYKMADGIWLSIEDLIQNIV